MAPAADGGAQLGHCSEENDQQSSSSRGTPAACNGPDPQAGNQDSLVGVAGSSSWPAIPVLGAVAHVSERELGQVAAGEPAEAAAIVPMSVPPKRGHREDRRQKVESPPNKSAKRTENTQLKGEEQQQAGVVKRARRGGGFFRVLLRLTVAGAVLGSAGAAAVVVSRERFGVDLVAESRRLAVAYGTIATRTSGVWVRQGSAAVRSWTVRLVEKVRRRRLAPVQDALEEEPGRDGLLEV